MTTDHPPESGPATAATGRRASTTGRGVEGTVVAALLVPLLSLGALLLLDPLDGGPAPVPTSGGATPLGAPATAPLTAVDLGCPALPRAAGAGGSGLTVAAPAGTAGASGGGARVDVVGGASRALDLSAGVVSPPVGPRAAVARGRGDLAAGLLALRSADGAAVGCPAPRPEQWFTGAGAGATHASVLELVNPDGGPAVADVTVLGSTGVLDVPALRGVTVPGGRSVRLDLASIAPSRDELALRVDVSRGRLTSTLLDRVDRLGRGAASQDWLAPQAEPAQELFLPGLVGGPGERTLVVANPGEDEARVEVEVVTPDSTIAPVGLEAEVIPPGSVAVLDLGARLREEVAGGALALRLTSSGPVTATLRQAVGGDLAHAVAAPALDSATTLLPPGASRLVLAGATGVGAVEVRSSDADGRALPVVRRELDPGRAVALDLPRGAVRAELAVQRATASAAVVVSAAGPGEAAVVLPLAPLVDRALVPRVAPGLP